MRVQTAIEMRQIAEPYIRNRAIRHFEKGRIVIFGCADRLSVLLHRHGSGAAGGGDQCRCTAQGTNVDGVYDKDPNKFADAVKYDQVTFKEVINRDLKVMDSTAFSLCKDNDMSILVFNLDDPENVVRAVSGEKIGTLVSNEER